MLRTVVFALVILCLWTSSTHAAWKAGAAKVNITPQHLMWMSGYGGRDRPAEGKLTDLWAKALVLEDESGMRVALVSLDLVGIDRDTSLKIRRRLEHDHGLSLAQVALCTSHTHTGPVVGSNLRAMYALDAQQWELIDAYTAQLHDKVLACVGEAVQRLAPATIAWGEGTADFAVNRRENPEPEVERLRAQGQLRGPVDHSVPVLRVAGKDGSLRAIVFGYACHATVLSFYQWSGDYPGFAMMELEAAHPGAVALFFAGCGGDQNPLPRRTVELAQQYGRRLAAAVNDVLRQNLRVIDGRLGTAYREIALRFASLPSRDELERRLQSMDRFDVGWAKELLQQIQQQGQLSAEYPYPVQTWRLGDGPRWVFLGGEVVVDYALRLKNELPGTTWVAGYTNDVMAYIPSLRVLREGRYEGATAMRYYGLPSAWAEDVEERIVGEVKRQAEAVR
jgi:neutral ceramidase